MLNITKFEDLLTYIHSMKTKPRVAVIAAHDKHTLDAIVLAKKNNLVTPILIGDAAQIKKILAQLDTVEDEYKIINSSDVEECLNIGVKLVNDKKAEALMKGKLETSQIMKAILKKENNMRKGGLISLIGFFEIPKYHKLLAITDIAINIKPDLESKKYILENAVDILTTLGISKPKIAVLSAVEKVNPKMQDTVDAAQLMEWNESGQIKDCIVEGPLSFDLATSKEAAKIKGIDSVVAGDVDLLLAPDLTSGNILVKCLTGFAGATTAGLVLGAKIPIILTSRSAEASDKYYSIALAAVVGAQLSKQS